MPLYEFVLEFSDRTETRLGDRAPRIGDLLTIDNQKWAVLERLAGQGDVAAAFRLGQPREPRRRRRLQPAPRQLSAHR